MPGAGLTVDVLVAGCGPVGATVGCLLAQAGVRVVVVDAAPVVAYPRAVAADDAAQRVLGDCGLRDVVDGFLHVGDVRVLGAGGREVARADLGSSAYARSGLAFFHQPSLERALRGRLDALGVEVRATAVRTLTQDAGGVDVELADGTRVRTAYLLGADGGRSTVRERLGVAYTGRTLTPSWVVVDAACPAPLAAVPSFAYLADPARPGVLMPRPGGLRLERVLHPGEDAAGVGPRLLADAVGTVPGLEVERSVAYAFHVRQAARWRVDRVLLLGDAAHAMPPFAGQGLGAGLRDAAALAWRLALVVGGRAGERVLDDAVAERRADVARMTRLSLALGAAVSARQPLALGRDAALAAALRLPGVGGWLRGGGVRPAPDLPHAAVRSGPGLPADGRALPSPVVRAADGRVLPLDALLDQPGHLLLGTGVDPDAALRAPDRAWWDALGARRLVLPRDAVLVDGAPPVPEGAVAVVRPDHALVGVVPAAALSGLSTAYRVLLGA